MCRSLFSRPITSLKWILNKIYKIHLLIFLFHSYQSIPFRTFENRYSHVRLIQRTLKPFNYVFNQLSNSSSSLTAMENHTTQVLTFEQVSRLDNVLNQVVQVHGRGNFPTLDVHLRSLIDTVSSGLKKEGLKIRDIRLNGSTASYILSQNNITAYNDIDLIFGVEIRSHTHLQQIKTVVLSSLIDFLPIGVSKDKMSSCTLKEAYVQKLVKVSNDNDRWSLISLSNNQGKNIELKFVDTMRRQFEFSVDSFQIKLDSLVGFNKLATVPMQSNFFPTVVAESVYGDIKLALYHLDNQLIATRSPEEIRGGGLLKYCNLLVRDYIPENIDEIQMLERYMCSRFFIDFGDVEQQRQKLENYLVSHFIGEDDTKCQYLLILYSIVSNSTVCLMGHERRQTLRLISSLAKNYSSSGYQYCEGYGSVCYQEVPNGYVYTTTQAEQSWNPYQTNLVQCY